MFGPLRGRLVDRVGSRKAVLLVLLPDLATDVAFIAAGHAHITAAALIGLAYIAGAVSAPAGPALRSVWSDTLQETDSRQAGYALMALMMETNFIAGPLLAGVILALWSPTAAVAATAVLSLAGSLTFATVVKAHRAPATAPSRRLPVLAGGGMRTVLATAAAFGLTFGLLDVAFPVFARAHGSAAAAGVLLSAFAVGGWIGGFLYGTRASTRTAGQRYPPLCLLGALGLAPLILTPTLPAMAALAILSGACFAPITNCQLSVIDEVAKPEQKAEAFSWLGTLYGAGSAIGAALAGQLITLASIRVALAAACAASTLAWLTAFLRSPTLDPSDALTSTPNASYSTPDA
jgi:MFS family permease